MCFLNSINFGCLKNIFSKLNKEYCIKWCKTTESKKHVTEALDFLGMECIIKTNVIV